jgi:hypothetical protein
MAQRTQTTAPIKATDRVTDRPPILEACRSLGLNDRQVALLMGVSPELVHAWVIGRKPMPYVRLMALLFMVTRLVGIVGKTFPPQSRYARRATVACDAATAWVALARHELNEDLGGVFHAEQIEQGYELGRRMLAKLEAQ